MYNIILSVGILAVVCGTQVLENADQSTTITVNSSTDLPTTTGSTVDNEKSSGVPCKFGDDDGVCTLYYHCNVTDYEDTDDSLFDLSRVIGSWSEPCPSYLETCCLPPKNKQPATPAPGRNETTQGTGCGWRNIGGLVQLNSTDGSRAAIDENSYSYFGELPWMVAILKLVPVNDSEPDGPKMEKYIGGGSLIHPRAVLTAAHISYNEGNATFIVRAGEWDTQSTAEIYPHQDRNVSSFEIHKDFNKKSLFYDIAILFLSEPMELAPNVGLACLPPPRERVAVGAQCVASGWGKDKYGKEGRYQVILKKVEVPVVQRQQCQSALRSTRLGSLFQLHSSFMCAGGQPGVDTCIGDGGSPLMCPIQFEPGRYMQSGIVAWGIGCGESGIPGVYVDVSNLRNWIDDKIAGKGLDPKVYTY